MNAPGVEPGIALLTDSVALRWRGLEDAWLRTRGRRGTGHRSLGVTCVVVLYGMTLEPGCADDP